MSFILKLFICLSFFLRPFCWAQVLLPTLGTSETEYGAALLVNKEAQSPIGAHLTQHPQISMVEKLGSLFSRAEQLFVESHDDADIAQAYEKVLDLENQEDWSDSHRRLFMISYLRLLQLPLNLVSDKKQKWMESVLFYISHLDLPRDLIPPPILYEVEQIQSEFPLKKIIFPDEIKQHFSKVLIQGKAFDTSKAIFLPATEIKRRWTFLSHFYEPETRFENGDTITEINIDARPFVEGQCDSAQIATKSFKDSKIYSPLNCGKTKESSKFTPVHLPSSDSLKPSSSWKMTKKHWVWVGIGAVALGFVLANQKKSQPPTPEPQPTESHGF